MKILYVASEARPFAASGGLADVSGSLPSALARKGAECRVVLPLHSAVGAEWRKRMRFLRSFEVPLGWRRQYCGVFGLRYGGVTFYFLDNEAYFRRDSLYGCHDDGERFAFFSKAVLEMLVHLDYAPDVIHCNDWQTALIPVFLNVFYRPVPKLRGAHTVFTIHNIEYQGRFASETAGDVCGLPAAAAEKVEFHGDCNYMKGALEECERITTVSPTYAREILDPYYGHRLDEILRRKTRKLSGILNGIDTDDYNPAADPALRVPYSADDPAGKRENKADLQRELGLPADAGTPLLVMVTRLVSHKGLDLVRYILDELLRRPVQMAVLGRGDRQYEDFLSGAQRRRPDRFRFVCGFLPDLARRMYAGADLFLMPSRSEPCGLSQMVALRYGAVPVVRVTGGLADTVRDWDAPGGGNGFTFRSYNAHDLLGAADRALGLYRSGDFWNEAVVRAMRCDFSWDRPAGEYMKLYLGI